MDIKKAIEWLLASTDISNYQISKATGVSQVSLNKFARGESNLDNMPLGNALKLYDYYLKNKEDIVMTNDKRDLLFGRLLSVCTVLGERVFEKNKPSVQERDFKKFPKAPVTTYKKLHENLMQYSYKFGPEENYLLSLFDDILGEMDTTDFNDAPLDKYLIGYYKQNHQLRKYRAGNPLPKIVEEKLLKKEYTNNTDEYQVVGNCEDLIFQGTEKECVEKLKTINIYNSKWSVVSVIEPGTTEQGEYLQPVIQEVKVDEDEVFKIFSGEKDDKN